MAITLASIPCAIAGFLAVWVGAKKLTVSGFVLGVIPVLRRRQATTAREREPATR